MTWQELQKKFLEKYFPFSSIQNVKRQLSTINMEAGELMHDSWNRFKLMLAKCPQYNISDPDLIQYYVNGMTPYEQ